MPQDTYITKLGSLLPQFRTNALIAMGSNRPSAIGSPTETILWGIKQLSGVGGVIRAESRLFATPAFPPGAGPEFVNTAVVLATDADPETLLARLHDIEAEAGRQRGSRWAQRTLDLDLIAMGDTVLPDAATCRTWMDLPLDRQVSEAPSELILPHPRVQDRAFVLVPLLEVAPDWVHPLTGQSVRQMLETLPQDDRNAVKPLVNSEIQP